MLLYLLTESEWDAETPHGIYSTFERAAEASVAARLGSSGMIYEFELDSHPHSPHDYGRQWYCSLGGDWVECTRIPVESE